MTHPDPYNLAGLKIEYVDADKITPYDRNTKVHDKAQIETLKRSIKDIGLINPLVLDVEGVIIAGHGRFLALCELGQVKNIPVRIARKLTKNQADAARIADNKTASVEYDSSAMAEELARLSISGEVDLEALGLDDRELALLTQDIGEMNGDAITLDLDQDIDDQDSETRDKVDAVDASMRPIAKVFGFKGIPIAHERTFRRFISKIEESTGKTGVDAWIEFMKRDA